MGLTKEKIEMIWAKVLELGLSDNWKGSYKAFCTQIIDSKTVILELPPMRAVYYISGVTPGGNADITIVVFDRSALGLRELYVRILHKVMGDFNLQRVTAMIPDWNTIAQNLARKIGFTLEGILRQWGRSNGTPNDVLIFGLLKEEITLPESRGH